MNKIENKFRIWLLKSFPNAYVTKIADFKQLGHGSNRGLPDYLIIYKGKTLYFEVKYIVSLNTLNIRTFTESQLIEFKRIIDANAEVYIAVYDGSQMLRVFKFSELLKSYINGKLSFKFSELENCVLFIKE